MSIILYTPATGFPDLEMKIAYGLARVGIEAGYNFTLIPEKGYYRIEFDTSNFDNGQQVFLTILNRLLTSDRFFDLGVKAKDKGKYSVNENVLKKILNANLVTLFTSKNFFDLTIKKDYFCGHKDIPKFGGRSGLILISSFHAGKPYERNKRHSTFNQSLCSICGYLAVLGLHSFVFNIQLGIGKNRKYCLVLPIPQEKLDSTQIHMLFSLQKTLHNFWLSDILPLKTFAIGLLSKVPSLTDIINNFNLDFHLLLLSKDNRGDTVVEQTTFVNNLKFVKFISDNPFNSVTIEKLLGSSKSQPKISSLLEITNILEYQQRTNLPKFARLYVQETSTNDYTNLLYPKTTEYLLKEVAMINQDIIENPALNSLAKTLRYFIKERKYSYADSIRNARKESQVFEETIVKMLREGELRRVQQEQERKQGKKIDNWIHLPKENEIKEVFSLANKDFESTKLALIMLAFSFPSGSEESKELSEVRDER